MANDKRSRKKAARDQRAEEARARLRRRNLIRLIGVAVVSIIVVVAALATGGDESSDEPTAASTPDEAPAEVACDGEAPPDADPQQYDAPPDLSLEQGVDYAAVIHTSCGDIEVDLLEDKAPQTVANFAFLAEEGFYSGLIWHRVERNAVIQTGDPNGQNGVEPDGPGYSIPDELPDKAREYVYGVVGMANAGPDTGGSQFFIVVHDMEGGSPAGYQPFYSIFGEVSPDSYETLEEISKVETQGGNDPVEAVKPITPVYINSIDIERN